MRARALTGIALLLLNFAASAGPVGTTLTGTKTASATVTQNLQYEWQILKTANAASYNIPIETSAQVQFTIDVTRTGPTVVSSTMSAIAGQVCLTNAGSAATQGLYVTDQLEQKVGSTWTAISGPTVISLSGEIAAGASQCWNYQFTNVSLDPENQYQNHAIAVINNWLGSEGTAHSFDVTAPVTITVQTGTTTGATATLGDTFQCPVLGFTCTAGTFPTTFTGSQSITYTETVRNTGAHCGNFNLVNTGTLTPSDNLGALDSQATTIGNAGDCGQQYCTGTIGYWKNHSERILVLLPQYLGTVGGAKTLAVVTVQIALNVLNQNVYGSPSNGITKLYSQLLAAKFGLANFADPTAISSTISAADAFLATHDYNDWASLSSSEKTQVNNWASALADWNLGTTGPGECGAR